MERSIRISQQHARRARRFRSRPPRKNGHALMHSKTQLPRLLLSRQLKHQRNPYPGCARCNACHHGGNHRRRSGCSASLVRAVDTTLPSPLSRRSLPPCLPCIHRCCFTCAKPLRPRRVSTVQHTHTTHTNTNTAAKHHKLTPTDINYTQLQHTTPTNNTIQQSPASPRRRPRTTCGTSTSRSRGRTSRRMRVRQ